MFQLELWLLGANVLKRKCVFDYEWKGVPEPSSATWKKEFGLTFSLHREVGHREGGRENPCSLRLCSSNLGAIWNYCAHANATTWAWAWPCSVLANCWVFLHVRSSVWTWSISWVREKTEAVPCWLRGDVGELSGTGLGFNWHLTKLCLGRSRPVAPWSSAAFSALAHHGRHLAVKGEPPEWGVSPAAPFYSPPLTTGGWTDCTDRGSQLHLWEIPRRERMSPGSSVLLFYCIPAGICLMWTEYSKFPK